MTDDEWKQVEPLAMAVIEAREKWSDHCTPPRAAGEVAIRKAALLEMRLDAELAAAERAYARALADLECF